MIATVARKPGQASARTISSPVARRTYRNPPIQEALVELRFAADADVTLAGRLHEHLIRRYPGKPEEQQLIAASVRSNPEDPSAGSLVLGQQGARVLLRSEDHLRLIGVGRRLLSIHNLRPYGGWEEDFRPRLLEAINTYAQLVPDAQVAQLGLRYINHITIPAARVDLDDFFYIGFEQPDEIAPAVNRFFLRLESELTDQIRLATTFASTEPIAGQSAFLLDLDLISVSADEPMRLDQVLPVIDDMRARERDAFETMIKDPLRRQFDA
jgi:uncharacterized protein (TIGR04255 family)